MNLELKDTIQKLVDSHLVEKKKMLAKFEQETESYSEYYKFFHDNQEKIHKMTEQAEDFVKEKQVMQDKVEELESEVEKYKLQSENPTEIPEKFTKFCQNMKTKLMDALHEIMRNDRPDALKVGNCQSVLVDTLNEVKSYLNDEEYTPNLSQVQESVAAPELKTYNTENDDDLIRTVEEALLIVRNDSCKKTHFKSQRSLSSLAGAIVKKSPEPKLGQKPLSPEFINNNVRSNKNLLQSQLRASQNEIGNPNFQDVINDSFGKVQPEGKKCLNI